MTSLNAMFLFTKLKKNFFFSLSILDIYFLFVYPVSAVIIRSLFIYHNLNAMFFFCFFVFCFYSLPLQSVPHFATYNNVLIFVSKSSHRRRKQTFLFSTNNTLFYFVYFLFIFIAGHATYKYRVLKTYKHLLALFTRSSS